MLKCSHLLTLTPVVQSWGGVTPVMCGVSAASCLNTMKVSHSSRSHVCLIWSNYLRRLSMTQSSLCIVLYSLLDSWQQGAPRHDGEHTGTNSSEDDTEEQVTHSRTLSHTQKHLPPNFNYKMVFHLQKAEVFPPGTPWLEWVLQSWTLRESQMQTIEGEGAETRAEFKYWT